MLINQWAIICGKPLVDKKTNTLSIIDHIEEIKIKKIPTEAVLELPFVLVSFWSRQVEEDSSLFNLRVMVQSPHDGELSLAAEHPDPIDMGTAKRMRIMSGFRPFKIHGYGEHEFLLQTSVTPEVADSWTTKGVAYLQIQKWEESEDRNGEP
jgi:hypothetical protein